MDAITPHNAPFRMASSKTRNLYGLLHSREPLMPTILSPGRFYGPRAVEVRAPAFAPSERKVLKRCSIIGWKSVEDPDCRARKPNLKL